MGHYDLRSTIIIALAATVFVLLGACTTSQPIQAAAVSQGPIVAATLAPVGSFEWHAAPTWTRLIVLRQRATRSLDAGKLTPAAAKVIQTHADAARQRLDEALAADKRGDAIAAQSWLAEARGVIDLADKILGDAK